MKEEVRGDKASKLDNGVFLGLFVLCVVGRERKGHRIEKRSPNKTKRKRAGESRGKGTNSRNSSADLQLLQTLVAVVKVVQRSGARDRERETGRLRQRAKDTE